MKRWLGFIIVILGLFVNPLVAKADVIIDDVYFDTTYLGESTGAVDYYGNINDGFYWIFDQSQWLIDQHHVVETTSNGLSAYFAHNFVFGSDEPSGDPFVDGHFSKIRHLEVGDEIEQDGQTYIIQDEIFFTHEQTDVSHPEAVYYRGIPITEMVYNWPVYEDAVYVQFCVAGGIKGFFAYPKV